MPVWMLPVSYTHIDVYKRQDLGSERLVGRGELGVTLSGSWQALGLTFNVVRQQLTMSIRCQAVEMMVSASE